ncbi:MAG: endonuclease domain-containing protein [Bacteroidetes bacterium]|nr:endonuclease domain-containing protein [Bacteroidota bacterium]
MKKDILRSDMYYGASISTIRTASILRKNTTLAEKVLWKKLRDRSRFTVKLRRQHPVGKFIVDFYCHELKLVIEIDGEIHNLKENLEYDILRQSQLENFGLKVIRFTNHEVIFGMDTVLSRISGIITKLTPLQGGRGAVTIATN